MIEPHREHVVPGSICSTRRTVSRRHVVPTPSSKYVKLAGDRGRDAVHPAGSANLSSSISPGVTAAAVRIQMRDPAALVRGDEDLVRRAGAVDHHAADNRAGSAFPHSRGRSRREPRPHRFNAELAAVRTMVADSVGAAPKLIVPLQIDLAMEPDTDCSAERPTQARPSDARAVRSWRYRTRPPASRQWLPRCRSRLPGPPPIDRCRADSPADAPSPRCRKAVRSRSGRAEIDARPAMSATGEERHARSTRRGDVEPQLAAGG